MHLGGGGVHTATTAPFTLTRNDVVVNPTMHDGDDDGEEDSDDDDEEDGDDDDNARGDSDYYHTTTPSFTTLPRDDVVVISTSPMLSSLYM